LKKYKGRNVHHSKQSKFGKPKPTNVTWGLGLMKLGTAASEPYLPSFQSFPAG